MVGILAVGSFKKVKGGGEIAGLFVGEGELVLGVVVAGEEA